MNRERIGRHFLGAFVLALALYLGTFFGIEHWRQAKGPWRVRFQSDNAGHPSVSVSHEGSGISGVRVVFSGEQIVATNLSVEVQFDAPRTNVPFGRVIFLDTTFLPGTVTFDFFGHEVQFIPRGLYVNRKERPWKSGQTVEVIEPEKILRAKPKERGRP